MEKTPYVEDPTESVSLVGIKQLEDIKKGSTGGASVGS